MTEVSSETLGVAQVYQERMVTHWSTFLARPDLEDLVRAGVSHVRIPVGDDLLPDM